MTPRRRDNLLWLTTAALLLACVGVAAWAVLAPLDDTESAAAGSTATRPATEPSAAEAGEINDAAWSRDLRQPLYDAPPPAAVAPPAPPPLPVTLLGTAVDAGRAQALLKLPDGRTRFAGVGEVVAGVEVLAVGPGSVEVRFNGRTATLTLPKEARP